MSLLGVIDDFNTGDYTVSRATAGSYVNGRYVAATPTTLTVLMSIQPSAGRVLAAMPEGQYGTEERLAFSAVELFTRQTARAPDTVTIDGEDWEVISCKRWQAFGETHWEAYLARAVTP